MELFIKLLHTKFHYYNISSLGDNIKKTLKSYAIIFYITNSLKKKTTSKQRQVFGCGQSRQKRVRARFSTAQRFSLRIKRRFESKIIQIVFMFIVRVIGLKEKETSKIYDKFWIFFYKFTYKIYSLCRK